MHLVVPAALVGARSVGGLAHDAVAAEAAGALEQRGVAGPTTAPPSAVVRFLVGKNENVVTSARLPTGSPR